jgi:hypothetical protein
VSHIRVRQLLLFLALVATVTGCRSEADTFIAEATLVGDATEGYGPYEVVARAHGNRAITSARLHWRVVGETAQTQVFMTGIDGDALARRGTISPHIGTDADGNTTREPFVLGTRIQYWVRIDASGGGSATAPLEAPGEAYEFVVGPARQPVLAAEVSPTRGASTGGTRVYVRGEGFRPTTEVLFGASLAADVTYHTSHLLEVVTPPTAPGSADLLVRNPTGAAGRLPDAFFFVPPPQPTTVRPDSGPTAGGTRLTIDGTGFQRDSVVTLDGEPVVDPIVVSPTRILATTPAHEAGPVTLRIVNPDAQSGELADAFTYVAPPRVLSVDPEAGPIEGGQAVTVSGEGFRQGLILLFDNEPAEVTASAGTIIRAVTPSHDAGFVDVTVVNPDGQRDTLQDGYAYLGPPELLDVTPDTGSTLGGTAVTLTGRNFFRGMTASFGGSDCAELEVISDTLATCVTTRHALGLVDVVIANIDNQRATLRGGFEYVPPAPEIIDIDPARGPDLGGTVVTITVRYLQPGASADFDGVGAGVVSVTIDGDVGTIIVRTPRHPEGLSDVTVTNPDGQTGTRADGFLFVGPPIIDSIDPDRGPDTGGQEVVITGRNFLLGMTVQFDGVEAEVIEIDPESGRVVVLTPPHAVGLVDVSIENVDGRSDTAESAYEYVLLPPTIREIDPARGPVWGGNEVRIVGTGFRVGVRVLVNGQPVPVTRISGTELVVVMPAGEAGEVTVEVINPDDQSASGPYTYVAPTFAPGGGLISGFTTVTIRGPGMDPDMVVRFGPRPAESLEFISENEVRVVTPAGAVGSTDIRIVTGTGEDAVFDGAFAYRIFVDVTAETNLPEENSCIEVEGADIDGDGDNDLVLALGGVFQDDSRNVPNAIYRNQNGRLVREEFGPRENGMNASLADMDGDSDLDLMIANLDGLNRLYTNDGRGNFTDVSARLPIGRASYDAGFLDANGDGRMDILLVNTAEPENLFINTGNGQFVDRTSLLPSNNDSEHDHDYHFGDLDGDGKDEIIISVDATVEANLQSRYDAFNRILSSSPGGQYTRSDAAPSEALGDYLDSQFGDIDGDGDLDVVMADNIDNSAPNVSPVTLFQRNGVIIYLNDGQGGLTDDRTRISQELLGPGTSVTLRDLDDDGDLDLMVAVLARIGDIQPGFLRGQPNWIFVNRGDGFFRDASAAWPALRDGTYDVEALDLDNDDIVDLYFCNYLTPNRLFVQTSTP